MPKQMLQTMPLPPFAWGGKVGAVSPAALCSAQQHLEPSALTAGQRGAGLMGTGSSGWPLCSQDSSRPCEHNPVLPQQLSAASPSVPASCPQLLLLHPHGQVAEAPRMPHPHALQPQNPGRWVRAPTGTIADCESPSCHLR